MICLCLVLLILWLYPLPALTENRVKKDLTLHNWVNKKLEKPNRTPLTSLDKKEFLILFCMMDAVGH